MQKIHVQPLGWLARLADIGIMPLMYLISRTFKEAPQQTHFWNNTKLKSYAVEYLAKECMVRCDGVPASTRWHGIPIFHIPIFGGWKDYIVLEPSDPARVSQEWYVGWITDDVIGISRIILRGPVRLLLGPCPVSFFGINAEKGKQLAVHKIGDGRIGNGGPHAQTPLL
ncbi:hypothetical protein A3C91_04950 [Candidatus Azambacteria bacterium RIFCSPHIGHO2_02_FULL_52_12]|uniref:Uncharacterized protein n=1 Tax=Candidatus Azambacteria bacterium RIFCSPLOWO2_01_FULL_46_25 TaxID=1797298 RepID=A0A1F5BVU9_9BACT|nr:MAG: hypothetical protein A3C91_04950 [Candidatus Azambacteria bacterium RIFCSPHIGHO2_02_FULL_52_12]OGD34737.1 MAG: hypothetical protein A2988_04560 [Candidatus Azambacteria bacterium RIFCSPLOWO2_01_FULL_46_25]OGD37186.1 MAG: hypothetical protein A2850_04845 [Candidatus Azambacteria bacterium RIFCSPHIGHO2_01_FULL_51_74]